MGLLHLPFLLDVLGNLDLLRLLVLVLAEHWSTVGLGGFACIVLFAGGTEDEEFDVISIEVGQLQLSLRVA
jgi:hypothetical protein